MFYLVNITPELLGMSKVTEEASIPPAWTLQARCTADDSNSCFFLKQLYGLAERNKRDGKDALVALHKLFCVAKTGQPLENFYDAKQCHPAHKFSFEGQIHKIWRIRKNSVRIYFFYAEGKIIYLAAVKPKRKNKLTSTEKTHLEDEVKLYLDAKAQQTLQLISKHQEN